MTENEKLREYKKRLIQGDRKVFEEIHSDIIRFQSEARTYQNQIHVDQPFDEQLRYKRLQEEMQHQATRLKSLLANYR